MQICFSLFVFGYASGCKIPVSLHFENMFVCTIPPSQIQFTDHLTTMPLRKSSAKHMTHKIDIASGPSLLNQKEGQQLSDFLGIIDFPLRGCNE